jgi:hypothetical protein
MSDGAGRIRRFLQQNARFSDVSQALPRITNEAALDQVTDSRLRFGRENLPLRFRTDHRGQRVADRFSAEEAIAGDHLPEDGAEGPDVGAAIHVLAARLLGAHVGGGAEDRAGLGHRGRDRR